MKPTEQLIYELYEKRADKVSKTKTLHALHQKPVMLPGNASEYHSGQLDNVITYKKEIKSQTEKLSKLESEIETLEKLLLGSFLEAEVKVSIPVYCNYSGDEYRSNLENGNNILIVKL